MSATLYCGDVREVLARLPEQSVQCCITSPPYFGLRDYGTATWEGGEVGCRHLKVEDAKTAVATSTLGGGKKTTGHLQEGYKAECGRCGARRIDNQLGLEKTPDEYVAAMVGVFREVRRVLRDDGVLWLNLGDSYNAYNGGAGPGSKLSKTQTEQRPQLATGYGLQCKTLKPKDLLGIPWRVAFALQADGWYLRSEVIWSKPNPMPESVTDRPTKAHEQIFLLSKSERYVYDAAAIAEPHAGPLHNPGNRETGRMEAGNRQRTGGTLEPDRVWGSTAGRNARSVWTIATQPYVGAHFATFPEELARRCILAGSRAGDTVLDPFGGSGTVAAVAVGHGRSAVHIDLNPAYIELARQRIGPMLCTEAA